METKRTYGLFLCCYIAVVVRSKSLPEIDSDGSGKNGTEKILVQLKEYSFEEQPKIERIIEKNKLVSHENGEVNSANLKEIGPALKKWKKLKFNKDMPPPPSVDFYGSIDGQMYVENKINNVRLPPPSQDLSEGFSASPDNHLSMPQLAADKSYVKKAEGHRRNMFRKKNVQTTVMESSVPVSNTTASEIGKKEQHMRIKIEDMQALTTPSIPEPNTSAPETASHSKTENNQNQEPDFTKQQDKIQSTEPDWSLRKIVPE
ncbi:uncharacterized protein LOC133194703 isoform X2 [Saccostrea echinata]|uniref:uncharacterized protein LOC133194703 isoform X2 n=1 Tax=Saccostrea echinata TaxID=191078 RepID=UPI002A8373CF|nr:uncharacterized protein LOC133194703 isoform X2 [Saccostrea echinata]